MLLDDGKLSLIAGGTAEDTAGAPTIDFAATLQGFIVSDQQKASSSTSENSAAADSSPDVPGSGTALIATSTPGSEGSMDRARASVLTRDGSDTALTVATPPRYVGTRSSEAAKAYQLAMYRTEPLKGATDSATEPGVQTISSSSRTNSAEVARPSALVPRSVNLSETPLHPVGRDLQPTTDQGTQSLTGSTTVGPHSSSSNSLTTHSMGMPNSRSDFLAGSAEPLVKGSSSLPQSSTAATPHTSDNSHLADVRSIASQSQTPSLYPEHAAVTLVTSSAPAFGVPKASTVRSATSTEVHEAVAGRRIDNAKVSLASATTANSATTTKVETTSNTPTSRTSTTSEVARVDTAPVVPNPTVTMHQAVKSPVTPVNDTLRSMRVGSEVGEFLRLPTSDLGHAPSKPPAPNDNSKSASLSDLHSNTESVSALTIVIGQHVADSTELPPVAVNEGDSKQSSATRVTDSFDPEGRSGALPVLESSGRAAFPTNATEADLAPVAGAKRHDAPTGTASPAMSSQPAHLLSLTLTSTELNAQDALPESYRGRPQILAVGRPSAASESPDDPWKATNRAARDGGILNAASGVVNGKQANGIDSRDPINVQPSEPGQGNLRVDGPVNTRRTSDAAITRGLAPAVSSGAKHLGSEVAVQANVVEPQGPARMSGSSHPATNPSHSPSRDFERSGAQNSATNTSIRVSTQENRPLPHSVSRIVVLSSASRPSGLRQPGTKTGNNLSAPPPTVSYHPGADDTLTSGESKDAAPNRLPIGEHTSSNEKTDEIQAGDSPLAPSATTSGAAPKAIESQRSENGTQPGVAEAETIESDISTTLPESSTKSLLLPAATPSASRLAIVNNSSPLTMSQHSAETSNTSRRIRDEDSSAIDTRIAASGDSQQNRTNAAGSASAVSRSRSAAENANRAASSLVENNPPASNSGETNTHLDRLLSLSTASETLLSSPQSLATAAKTDAQTEPFDPENYLAARQNVVGHKPSLVGAPESVPQSGQPTSSGGAAESVPVRPVQELAPLIETGRVVDLKVQLADGQTAHATVRERAGSVDVKIVTSTSASAARVSGEIDNMRQNLDAAGLRLGHSEVSYQQGSGGGRGGEDRRPAPQANRAPDKQETFTLNEVVE